MNWINIATVVEKLPSSADIENVGVYQILGPEYRFVRYESLYHDDQGNLIGAWCKTASDICSTPQITGVQDPQIFGCARQVPACTNYSTHMHMEWLLKGDPSCPKTQED